MLAFLDPAASLHTRVSPSLVTSEQMEQQERRRGSNDHVASYPNFLLTTYPSFALQPDRPRMRFIQN